MDEQWLSLIPLGTGVFALVGALGGSWLGATLSRLAEGKQWKRNRKQEAYAEFLSQMKFSAHEVMVLLSEDKFPDLLLADSERLKAYMQVELVGSPAVRVEAESLINELKYFRILCNETNDFRSRAAERLANPREGDTEIYRAQLAERIQEEAKLPLQKLAALLTEAVWNRTHAVVQVMRKDLGLPPHAPVDGPESEIREARDEQRKMWNVFGFGVDEDDTKPLLLQVEEETKRVVQEMLKDKNPDASNPAAPPNA